MWSKLCLALALVSLSCVQYSDAQTNKVVCYLGSWAYYRPGDGKFAADNIDPNLCTHVIYGFVKVDSAGKVVEADPWLDNELKNLEKLNNLKKINPNLKTLLAVGGWNAGSTQYSTLVADPNRRAVFIQSALELVQKHGCNGFDLDWEFPNQRGGRPEDVQNFVTLLKEMRAIWDKNGLLLTAAVGASQTSADLSYDIPALSKYLDIINIMAYDMHGGWESVTGINAPLYPSKVDTSDEAKKLTVEYCIKYWISKGADPQKIALGVGTYGHSYALSDPNNRAIGAPISGLGAQGPFTQQAGSLGYNEICLNIKNQGWTEVWDESTQCPIAYKGNQWVGYDNARSMGIKVDFAKSLNLGGIMIWSIETDDFRGACGRKNDLLTTINEKLGNKSDKHLPEQTDPKPSPKPKESEESSEKSEESSKESGDNSDKPSNNQICTKTGIVRDPKDCSIFYYCLQADDRIIQYASKCPGNLVFDNSAQACNFKQLVKGC